MTLEEFKALTPQKRQQYVRRREKEKEKAMADVLDAIVTLGNHLEKKEE